MVKSRQENAAIEYLASLSEWKAQQMLEESSRRRGISVGKHVYIQDPALADLVWISGMYTSPIPSRGKSFSWLHSIRICGEDVKTDLARDLNGIRDAVVNLASLDKSLCPQRQQLSLLDVAVLVGDRGLAQQLFRLGVPKIFRFEYGDFIMVQSGLFTEKCWKKIEAALWADIEIENLPTTTLWDLWPNSSRNYGLVAGLLDLDSLFARAIAGRQRKAAFLLRKKGAVAAFKCNEAHALFRVARGRPGELRFFLDPGCIHLAVDLGVELRSIKVDPVAACHFACCLHRREFWKSDIVSSWDMTPTTLLAMAVLCGQDRVAELLAERSCDASSLQSKDVLFCPQLVDRGVSFLINADETPMQTAKHMYQQVRNKHNILIEQAATVCLPAKQVAEFLDLVGHIAEFALAIPCLPEFLQDNRQCSGPSAMEEATVQDN